MRWSQTGSIRAYAASLVARRRADARLLPDAVMMPSHWHDDLTSDLGQGTRMLSLIVFLPLAGALALLALPNKDGSRDGPSAGARWRSRWPRS